MPKLHEEMTLSADEEPAERKRQEQPALSAFAMSDAPTVTEQKALSTVATAPESSDTPAGSSGLFTRFFGTLKNIFSAGETSAQPAAGQSEAPKAEEKQEQRKSRNNNRRERNVRRDNRAESGENRETREDNRRNRREKQPQNAELRGSRSATPDETEKNRNREDQSARRERQRRRHDDKRQAQQEPQTSSGEELNTLAEERTVVMPRRQRRQLSQKVRLNADTVVTEAVLPTHQETAVVALPVVADPHTKIEAEKAAPAVDNGNNRNSNYNDARESNGMPRRSRRSPRHLRVSGQRRRRYRDERCLPQSPMPLTVACASPEMASGKVWVHYPVVQSQEAVAVAEVDQPTTAVAAAESIANSPVAPVVADSGAVREATRSLSTQAEPEITSAAAKETVTVAIPSAAETPVTTQCHVSASVTRAPAPDYLPEVVPVSDWVRPPFVFNGKGAAGAHSASHHAAADATRPQPVEAS